MKPFLFLFSVPFRDLIVDHSIQPPLRFTLYSHLWIFLCFVLLILQFSLPHCNEFQRKIHGYKVDPRVAVAKFINPELIGGRMFLNATSGSHFYFDKETEAGESYFYELVTNDDTGNTSAASLLRGYAKVERLTIAEMNQFIIIVEPEIIEFTCSRKVTSVKTENG
ncbi:Uncharacterized protein Rs2_27905 [Raphanus sativus]|nr:Uncharacterized protein Rs2_27905 [Raphanus sativus]